MPVLLITYTLKNNEKDYSQLFEAIKNNSNGWWHYLKDAWIVNSSLDHQEYADRLYPFIEKTDYFLVVKITKNYQGWLPKDAWDWLNKLNY